LSERDDAALGGIVVRRTSNGINGDGFDIRPDSIIITDGGDVHIKTRSVGVDPMFVLALTARTVRGIVARHVAYCVFGCAACRPGEFSAEPGLVGDDAPTPEER
jgi:hypothetical protein